MFKKLGIGCLLLVTFSMQAAFGKSDDDNVSTMLHQKFYPLVASGASLTEVAQLFFQAVSVGIAQGHKFEEQQQKFQQTKYPEQQQVKKTCSCVALVVAVPICLAFAGYVGTTFS